MLTFCRAIKIKVLRNSGLHFFPDRLPTREKLHVGSPAFISVINTGNPHTILKNNSHLIQTSAVPAAKQQPSRISQGFRVTHKVKNCVPTTECSKVFPHVHLKEHVNEQGMSLSRYLHIGTIKNNEFQFLLKLKCYCRKRKGW
jgi:hypothetical protein